MSKKENSYVMSRKEYNELMLALAYAIIRSDHAINLVNKVNRSVDNVSRKK
ncbi:hypothetical protein Makalu003_163 [Escherichia phage Ec_Makalu_003]|uniref:Uncharacterized protein n=1 Tax=Escherichia phage Ec_Makalu_003 TaxID=2704944 RepID=A0A6B9SQQ6_9CAUD|nr:hypothetical protein Makalu003_163 [Escherichia phage Ec_Makalu_003]